MIIRNLRQLIKNIDRNNFIISKNKSIFFEYEEKLKFIFSKLNIKLNLIEDENYINEKNKLFFTLDPKIYTDNKNKIKIDLFVFSVDRAASNFLGLYNYASILGNKKINFKNIFFKKYLLRFDTKVKIKSTINFILSYLNLFVYRSKNKLFPFRIEKSFNTYNGKILGKGYSNRYINSKSSDEFKKKFNYVLEKLKNNRSKRIYNMVAFEKPTKTWKHKYFQFYLNNQYFDYIDLYNKPGAIINIGVNDGFEIPFFLINNPEILLNIDPTGEEMLSEYVRYFSKNYLKKTKIIYCTDYLYKNDYVYNNKTRGEPTDLLKIIDKYKLEKINLIKSDIEGLEKYLVDDLKTIIPKYRPNLAISIYHLDKSITDMNYQYVELPYKLMNYCSDYNFYINHYTYHRSETILYCVPKEKF